MHIPWVRFKSVCPLNGNLMECPLLGKCEILLLLLGNRLILLNTSVTELIFFIRLARNLCMFPLLEL